MEAIVCDMCGKVVDLGSSEWGEITFDSTPNCPAKIGIFKYQLCSDCFAKIKRATTAYLYKEDQNG